MNIVICAQDKVSEFDWGMFMVLQAIDHTEALVTDESRFSDFFLSGWSGEEEQEDWEYAKTVLEGASGREVKLTDYLWEVARDIEEHDGE